MTRPTVYVVDDDASIRTSLERLLEAMGFAVESFDSADGFLSRNIPDGPTCVLLDIRMPGKSGLELQDELGGDPTIPIIFITGHGTVPSTVRAMKAGAIDFLEKPFEDQELLECVNRALERSTRTLSARTVRSEIQRRFDSLTERESQVFKLVVKGMTNVQIGVELGVSMKTVKVHRGRVMKKLQVPNLAMLVQLAENMNGD